MKIPQRAEPEQKSSVSPEVMWRQLTEALIFSAPYSSTEYMRILDRTGRPYNRDAAQARCEALADAIHSDYAHVIGTPAYVGDKLVDPTRLLRCHAANDDASFRLRHADILPKRPHCATRAERRTGITDNQRMSAASALVDAL